MSGSVPRDQYPVSRDTRHAARDTILVELVVALIALLAPLIWGQLDPVRHTEIMRLTPLHIGLWLIFVWVYGLVGVWARQSQFASPNTQTPKRPYAYAPIRLWEDAALLVFILLCFISLIDSIYLRAGLLEMMRLFDFAILFLLTRRLAQNHHAALRLMAALVIGATLTAVWGLREYILRVYFEGDSKWRIFSTFFNQNLLGGYLSVAFLPALALALSRPKGLTVLPWLPVPLILLALVLTRSKGGFLGFGAGMVVFAVQAWRQQGRARPLWRAEKSERQSRRALPSAFLIGAALALVLIVALLPPIRERFTAAFTTEQRSTMHRILLWQSTWRIASAHPFNGTGLGTFEFIYPKFALASFTRTAHQSYLQIASECGFPALIAFLTFLGLVFLRAMRNQSHESQITNHKLRITNHQRWLSCGALGGATAFLVHNLVDYSWYLTATQLSFSVLMGTAAGLSALTPQPLSQMERGKGKRFAVFALIGAMSVVYAVRAHVATSLAEQARESERKSHPFTAERLWRRAIAWEPWCAAYHLGLARTMEALAMFGSSDHEPEYWRTQAILHCQTAIRLQPTRASNHKLLGDLLRAKGDFRGAEAAYEKALHWNPHDTNAMRTLAELYLEMGERGKAVELYKSIVAIQDSDYERFKAHAEMVDLNYGAAHLALGIEAIRRQRDGIKSAIKEFEKAAQVAEAFLRFSSPLLPYMEDEQLEYGHQEAKSLLMQAYWHLSKAYRKMGDESRAKEFEGRFRSIMEGD